jgi:hypothetical protein
VLSGAHGEEIVRDVVVDAFSNAMFTAGEDGVVRAWKMPATAAVETGAGAMAIDDEDEDEGEDEKERAKREKKERKERRKEKKEKREKRKGDKEKERFKPY